MLCQTLAIAKFLKYTILNTLIKVILLTRLWRGRPAAESSAYRQRKTNKQVFYFRSERGKEKCRNIFLCRTSDKIYF